MAKKAYKNKLTKKLEKVGDVYHKFAGKHQELINLYQGKTKEGKKNSKIHRLKNRYQAAKQYIKCQKDLTEEEKAYLAIAAVQFMDYDKQLDKKRKNELYKTQLNTYRTGHKDGLSKIIGSYKKKEKDTIPLPLFNQGLEDKVNSQNVPQGSGIEQRVEPAILKRSKTGIKKRKADPIIPIPTYSSIGYGSKLLNSVKKGIKKVANESYKLRWGFGMIGTLIAASLIIPHCANKNVVSKTPIESLKPKKEYVIPSPNIKRQGAITPVTTPKNITPKKNLSLPAPKVIKPVLEEKKPVTQDFKGGSVYKIYVAEGAEGYLFNSESATKHSSDKRNEGLVEIQYGPVFNGKQSAYVAVDVKDKPLWRVKPVEEKLSTPGEVDRWLYNMLQKGFVISAVSKDGSMYLFKEGDIKKHNIQVGSDVRKGFPKRKCDTISWEKDMPINGRGDGSSISGTSGPAPSGPSNGNGGISGGNKG